MIYLLYGIKMWATFSFVLSQFKRLIDVWTDRQTDGRTAHNKTARLDSCSAVTTPSAPLRNFYDYGALYEYQDLFT